jgi:hypothetical protein
MMVVLAVAVAVAVALLPGLLDTSHKPAGGVVRLDFETGDLSQYDSTQRAADDRLVVVRNPKREGNYAARFEVREGDTQAATTGVRAELIAERDGGRMATAGDERWYSWSTLFPPEYPVSDQWQTFVQWKNEGTGSPPLAMTVKGDEILLSGGEQNEFHEFWKAPMDRGRWHDFVAHIRWSADAHTGFVELWHNGRRVVPRTPTATLYRDEDGGAIPNYLKIGLYRSSAIQDTQVVYHDALRVAPSREALR